MRRPDQIEECLRHSDTVYNLVGREFETKCVKSSPFIQVSFSSEEPLHSLFMNFRNFDFKSVQVDGAESIAQIAASAGVSRLIHVSHLNADKTSVSKFYQAKAEGEEKVKAAFPNATIVRPAIMYGYEDRLLNNMAST